MLKKVIKYTDFEGQEREETFYFNISKAELTELQLSEDGGLSEKIKRVIEAKSNPEILKIFKDFILLSYGKKSDDGKYFRKSKEYTDDFISTNAYDVLFSEIVGDTTAAVNFIKGILPQEITSQMGEFDGNNLPK